MLWVLKRTHSGDSFEHPKHMLKLMNKKIFTVYAEIFCLSKPVSSFSYPVGLLYYLCLNLKLHTFFAYAGFGYSTVTELMCILA